MAVATKSAPNLKLSHLGINVVDIDKMEAFYTSVLGYTVTDRGDTPVPGLKLVFMSRDPLEHHQLLLCTGRPEHLEPNTMFPRVGPSINQISFELTSLADLRDMNERLSSGGALNLLPGNHGIAWSIYCHDPEGNHLEFFVDTPWYMTQPFTVPLDFSMTDAEIYAQTREMCKNSAGYEPYTKWRARIAPQMTPFIPAAKMRDVDDSGDDDQAIAQKAPRKSAEMSW